MGRPVVSVATALAMVTGQLGSVALPVAVGSLALAAPAAAQQWQEIECASRGRDRAECALPRGVQRVELVRQLSSSACVEGRSWGTRANFGGPVLWVDEGCRGRFALVGAGGGWGGGGNPGWGGGQGGYAAQLTCDSYGSRPRRCEARTDNRVALMQVRGGRCAEGRDWGYDARSIWVDNGCQATFAYGYAGGGGGNWGGGYPGGGSFAAETDCQSWNGTYQRCNVNTGNRVGIVRVYAGQCRERRDWGYDDRSIWVDNGCRARFGYRYQGGGYPGGRPDDGGSNAGGVIAGVAIAAGLIALLAASGKKSGGGGGAPASVSADYDRFPSDAREEARACMAEAGRQIGATGGSRVALNRVDGVVRSGRGYRIEAQLAATYDGRAQTVTMHCTAEGNRVSAFDVKR